MHRSYAVLLALVALVGVGCGGDGDDSPAAPTAAAPTAPTEPAAATTEPPADHAVTTVAVASSDLGEILVDGDGMTLYLFQPDDARRPTCEGDCAAAWPPLAGPAAAGEGVDGAQLGTAEHPEGMQQVTFAGWPLYHFSGDEAPGDTNGQGLNDVWFVVDPAGEAIVAAAATGRDDTGY